MTYHLSKKGEPRICKATVEECPLSSMHFETKVQGEKYYEERISQALNISKQITGDNNEDSDYDESSEKFYNSLSSETSNLIAGYVNHDYQEINEALWNDEKPDSLEKMNKALSKRSEIKSLWRKPPNKSSIDWSSVKTGDTIDLKGFTSTSTNPNVVIPLMVTHEDKYMNEVPFDEWEYEDDSRFSSPVKLPENYKNKDPNVVIQIITDIGQPVSAKSHMSQEKEILIPAQTKWEVVGIKNNVEFSSEKNLVTGESTLRTTRTATVFQLMEKPEN